MTYPASTTAHDPSARQPQTPNKRHHAGTPRERREAEPAQTSEPVQSSNPSIHNTSCVPRHAIASVERCISSCSSACCTQGENGCASGSKAIVLSDELDIILREVFRMRQSSLTSIHPSPATPSATSRYPPCSKPLQQANTPDSTGCFATMLARKTCTTRHIEHLRASTIQPSVRNLASQHLPCPAIPLSSPLRPG